MIPWKLLLFIIIVVLVIIFIGFNLDYRMTISFAIFKLENVPTIVVLAAVFLFGILFSFLFIFIAALKKPKNGNKKNDTPKDDAKETK